MPYSSLVTVDPPPLLAVLELKSNGFESRRAMVSNDAANDAVGRACGTSHQPQSSHRRPLSAGTTGRRGARFSSVSCQQAPLWSERVSAARSVGFAFGRRPCATPQRVRSATK
eukprot:2001408-Prymnesium_polylepis.1